MSEDVTNSSSAVQIGWIRQFAQERHNFAFFEYAWDDGKSVVVNPAPQLAQLTNLPITRLPDCITLPASRRNE